MAGRAFTLVEIAIALALVALAVTSSLLLFPTGIKAQQLARFRLYAAAKAQEMVECFAACANGNANIDTEAFDPWDLPIGYRATTPDLETRLATHQFGIAPLPLDLARRIDSDGDEIARILDEGGYVYYSAPQATTGLDPTASSARVPNELQKLVFAVSGYAQNNSLYSFPWKGWPYYVPYPSPPIHGLHLDQYLPAGAQTYVFPGGGGPRQSYCWEGCDPDDPGAADIGVVFEHEEGGLAYGYRPYAYDARLDVAGARDGALAETSDKRAAAVRYVQAALWYARKVGMPDELWSDPPLVAPTDFWGGAAPSPPAAQQVLATRFLAHAGLCLTRWFSLAELGGQPSAPGGGVHCAAVALAGAMSPDAFVSHDKIVAWHEACMNLVMRYAASFPYDWGAPRPTNRATMMDFPLIEWDLSDRAAMLSGPIDGGGGTATQWRPLPATPIVNAGRSYQFPTKSFDAVWSAHRDRVTITAPFDACERCRQLVFWSVDWQSYEDFETAPSAPLDASKYPLAGPLLDGGSPLPFDARMDFLVWTDQHAMFRNPEKLLVFRSSVAGLPTGSDVGALRENESVAFEAGQDKGVANAHIFCGVFGADRNCNDRLDRGPVPASARLRATRIARFNFYDPRVPLTIR